MKLGVILNCFTYPENQHEYGASILEKVCPRLDMMGIDLDLENITPTYMENKLADEHLDEIPQQDMAKVRELLKTHNNKGIIVRTAMKALISRGADFILHVDGSSKFGLEEILEKIPIITKYIIQPEVDAVLTDRRVSGIDKIRTLIEDFEKQIVLHKFPSVNLKDGQSGFWCIRISKDFSLDELSAEGYELELDILFMLLGKEKRIIWEPVNVIFTGVSKFTFESNLLKMRWLKEHVPDVDHVLSEFIASNAERIRECNEEAAKDKQKTFDEYCSEVRNLN